MEQNKISNRELLYWIVGLFFILFSAIGYLSYFYFHKMNELFLKALNQKVCIADIDIQKISYENFISQYYQTQSSWLNFWLAFIGGFLTIITIIMPIMVMKNNEKQEEKFDKISKEAKNSIEKTQWMQKVSRMLQKNILNDIENHKKKMYEELKNYEEERDKDIKKIKEFLDKAEEAERNAKINRLIVEGEVCLDQKKYNEAISKYEKALKLNEENKNYILNSEILNNIGSCYAKQKKFDEAISKYEEALKLNEDCLVFENIACCYLEQEKYDKALKFLNKILSLNPNNLEIYYDITEAYIFDNKILEAIDSLNKYLKIREPFIYSDDFNKWINKINSLSNLDQKQKNEIMRLINSLPQKTRG